MYIPNSFQVSDQNEKFSFIESNSFGQLISTVDGRPFSTHAPFLLSGDQTKLFGHLAKQNPQVQNIEGQDVLVTLQGAHDYISPSWYENPGVPTWNYQAVHIYGICRLMDSSQKVAELLERLTKKHESKLSNPWLPEYNPSMLNAIVGIEISIEEIQCKYKLSQNKSNTDRKGVIENLKAIGSSKLAKAMQNRE